MAAIALRHTVEDYDAWKVVFDEHGTKRKEHGCTGETVLVGEGEPRTVMALTWWPSLEAAHGFVEDPTLREAMQRAGVTGPPRVEFYEEARS